MKRKGACAGHLLALEGTYELAARSTTVRVADVAESLWDVDRCCAVVHKERTKHLNSMGTRPLLTSASDDRTTAMAPGALVLYPEEAALLVEQGVLLVRWNE